MLVVRAGGEYFVYDPFEPLAVGEWNAAFVFDLRWRPRVGYAF